jgi:uncharacterized protein (DUF2236 family)
MKQWSICFMQAIYVGLLFCVAISSLLRNLTNSSSGYWKTKQQIMMTVNDVDDDDENIGAAVTMAHSALQGTTS